MPVADQRVCSPAFCMSVLGTESLPSDAAVMASIILRRQARSSCQISRRLLCCLVAALSARLALKSAKNPMGVRVVTVSDIYCGAK